MTPETVRRLNGFTARMIIVYTIVGGLFTLITVVQVELHRGSATPISIVIGLQTVIIGLLTLLIVTPGTKLKGA